MVDLPPLCNWHERSKAVAWLRYHSMPNKPAGLCSSCEGHVRRNVILHGRASLIAGDGTEAEL